MLRYILCFFLLFPFTSYAQEIREKETNNHFFISPLVASYSLTEDFLLKLEKIGKECENSSPTPETTDIKNNVIIDDTNIEEYIIYISNKPKFVNILRENSLTPKEFVIGLLALQTTLVILTNENPSLKKQNIISSSNLEFGKKHMYRIIKVLRQSC
ncbi:hypothetical protein [Bartonella raoultii]|uniref:Uncharacterized protein n=1 Tax=Bartonella raoultii TaxID=1457020 RepID=A0ABS7I582_9HYPH|nr:hypothetical protein [Bartonella raoultii]MBX4336003.1 hypothetical protein [Bartonella raoultii]